jgi:hypothetical protein
VAQRVRDVRLLAVAEKATLAWVVEEVDRERVVSLWLSVSSVASLPEEERRELADYLRGELEAVYRMPVATDVYWTKLSTGCG